MTRRHRIPGKKTLPAERICAIEIADGGAFPFKLPGDTPTARRPGSTVFFFKQTGGQHPAVTGPGVMPGVNIYDDHDARVLWERILRDEAA